MFQNDRDRQQKLGTLCLWYDKPVEMGKPVPGSGKFGTTGEEEQWQQFTLPLGNSRMGINLYGGIEKERITFNHKTLWNGGPARQRPAYKGGNEEFTPEGELMSEVYQTILSLFRQGKKAEASALCGKLVGSREGYGAYQSWGSIRIDFEGLDSEPLPSDYKRSLDMENALAGVEFTMNHTKYSREYLVSYPDDIIAVRLTAQGKDTLHFCVSFPVNNEEGVLFRELGKVFSVRVGENTIVTSGYLQDNQMQFCSVMKVILQKGSITANAQEGSLSVRNAEQAVLLIAAGTDYENRYPDYRTGETEQQLIDRVMDTVERSAAGTYEEIKKRHENDYKGIFARVSLDLGQIETEKPTDRLLEAYRLQQATCGEKRVLESILYQYGRFLTIQSSRRGDLPSNLQGVWQNRVGDENRIPWGCDYHMNVNLQMNYWPVYSTNMAECAEPLIAYVNSLREPGRITASYYYGVESGEGEVRPFSAHTQNTPFGWTCPGWKFSWGWSPAAVPWILQNCWEYYEYTGDTEYLREHIYPMMREEVALYDRILTDSGVSITLADGTPSTRLVSAPAYSPEHGPYTMGNAYEQELLHGLYSNVIAGAKVLGIEEESIPRWAATRERLAPVEIGKSGQVKEWYDETTLGSIGEKKHRHMSHLLGVYPGSLMTAENKEYKKAVMISLADRGMESTGWGMGQRLNAWARMGRGKEAYQIIEALMKGGLYPNLWDCHPPFQIDGNFGYTAGVTEMLMQSHLGYLHILPALPDAWEQGGVTGLKARGNIEVAVSWRQHRAEQVRLLSVMGGAAAVKCLGIKDMELLDENGREISYAAEGDDTISFSLDKGSTALLRRKKIS